ncbi:MAG: response regulator transcription factor, partial [Acidobacteria bacterium]|nr:response regulator transcription factor [Acidobacteriota bacterium]
MAGRPFPTVFPTPPAGEAPVNQANIDKEANGRPPPFGFASARGRECVRKGYATDSDMDHSQIRVIVAEVHPMFRAGLRHTVESNPLYLVVGEAADVGGVLELVRSKAPDILICDIDLDSGNA